MPRPRLARTNKPVAQGGHVELVRAPSSGRKYSPARSKVQPRADYNPETHGQCTVCGDIVRKRKDGTLYTHRMYCIGSPLPMGKHEKAREENDKIRKWAKSRGYAVTANGRIPESIHLAYEKANNGESSNMDQSRVDRTQGSH